MTDQPLVLSAPTGSVTTISLNRPQYYNALTRQLHKELLAALRQATRDPAVRAVILTGVGTAFCSGQDLREFPLDNPLSLADELRRNYHPVIMQMRNLGKPLIAAVNGPAAGAGMSLTLACDIRIAADTARFATAFARVGLVPDAGMTYFLPRLIGHGRALQLCMTAGELDAPKALEWGLISAIHPADEISAAAQALAEQLAAGPTATLSLIRRAFDHSLNADLPAQLEYEAMAQNAAGYHPDFREGVQAFREKRLPRFGQ